MRALSRQDRPTSVQLVDEGGRKVKERLFLQPRTWYATLAKSPEDMFSSEADLPRPTLDDGKTPILCITPKEL